MIAPDWIRGIHQRIAGELFPDWAGSFRHTDVQVGTHMPPQGFNVPVYVSNFCLDLAERMCHVSGLESIADLLAWVDWRFQWIHPFKDFNGRVGRILLVALCYKLGLPPINPAADDELTKPVKTKNMFPWAFCTTPNHAAGEIRAIGCALTKVAHQSSIPHDDALRHGSAQPMICTSHRVYPNSSLCEPSLASFNRSSPDFR